MKIFFKKISDEEHAVRVIRKDGSEDSCVLNSRSYLRHDLSHFAVESELPLKRGYWGCVANGTKLTGGEFSNSEIELAESLAAPIQILIRDDAAIGKYLDILNYFCRDRANEDLARRIHERARKLLGHWRATAYGEEMAFEWLN